MKFFPRKTYNYIGVNSIETSTDYILTEDVLSFHGRAFLDTWLKFIDKKPTIKIDNKEGYYYYDYEFAARQTDSFLNQI